MKPTSAKTVGTVINTMKDASFRRRSEDDVPKRCTDRF